MNYKILLSSIILFPLIDYFYLSSVSAHFSNLIKKITKKEIVFNYEKAIGAYVFLIFGLYYFILHNINKNNLKTKIIESIILGLVIYGTYDFTNGAILEDYDYYTMITDTIWGGVLFGLVTYTSFQLTKII